MGAQEIALSPKATERLAHLRHVGEITEAEAAERGCRLVTTEHGGDEPEHWVQLFLLIDGDGFIRDVRLRCRCEGVLLLVYDLLAEMCLGCTMPMAAAITPEQILFELEWRFAQDPLPELPLAVREPFPILVKAAKRHQGSQPVPAAGKVDAEAQARRLAEWNGLPLMERLRRVEAALDEHVRPMLAADGGGIELVDLRDDEVWIDYQGACHGCPAALGGTLYFVMDTLRAVLGVDLYVRVQGMQ